MSCRVLLAVLALLLLAPPAAPASSAGEERRGGELISELWAGSKTCDDLSGADFNDIGKYAMRDSVGSAELDRAMDDRMEQLMGEQAQERVFELLGRRYTRCDSNSSGAGGRFGPGMMRGDGDGDTLAVVVIALVTTALLAAAVLHGRSRRRPPGAPPTQSTG